MDVVNKSTVKRFWIGTFLAFVVALLLFEWLAALVIFWALLAMGGVIPAVRKYQRAYSLQWGVCFGLGLGIATLIFGPWNFYA